MFRRAACLSLMLALLLPGYALAASFFPDSLVDSRWLDSRMSEPGVVIVDVRRPNDYAAGHIPGAVNIPIDSLFASGARNDLIAPPATVQKLLGEAGIANASHVVVYDNGSFKDAARAIWVFEVYGHRSIAMLDGGILAWVNALKPLSTENTFHEPASYIPTVDPKRMATLFSTRLAIDDPRTQIIDARTSEEFDGVSSKSRLKGHIPSAVNVPSDLNYETVNGVPVMKSLGELKQIYGGLDKDKKVIAYCNKGKESALTHFVLRRLGYNVSAYDGGWYEWGNTDGLPINNGSGLADSDKQ